MPPDVERETSLIIKVILSWSRNHPCLGSYFRLQDTLEDETNLLGTTETLSTSLQAHILQLNHEVTVCHLEVLPCVVKRSTFIII